MEANEFTGSMESMDFGQLCGKGCGQPNNHLANHVPKFVVSKNAIKLLLQRVAGIRAFPQCSFFDDFGRQNQQKNTIPMCLVLFVGLGSWRVML